MMETVIINKSVEITARRQEQFLEMRSIIALLAAEHVRKMLADGWTMEHTPNGYVMIPKHTVVRL